MTNEQIEKKIKELKELQKKNIKEQKKKERQKQKQIKAKNDKTVMSLVHLLHKGKTDEEIIKMYLDAIKKNAPDRLEQAEKIIAKNQPKTEE